MVCLLGVYDPENGGSIIVVRNHAKYKFNWNMCIFEYTDYLPNPTFIVKTTMTDLSIEKIARKISEQKLSSPVELDSLKSVLRLFFEFNQFKKIFYIFTHIRNIFYG